MVMFDTLNRRLLPSYGCDWTHTPNFQRLAKRSVTFDNAFIGSMPCMPARRELHTGRYNFLHRSWGPLEPFDESAPAILNENGVYTHIATDHYHYWECGGSNYIQSYRTHQTCRGQEGDAWRPSVADPVIPPVVAPRRNNEMWRQDWVNRQYINEEKDWPQYRTFDAGLSFLEKNWKEDNWFLQIETFDPHEPFFAPQKYRDLYKHEYKGKHFDWPLYAVVEETPEEVEHLQFEYTALLSFCDAQLGRVLDFMDDHELWDDTLLIVNTDHGFLLGEHGFWAKVAPPFYNEVAHIPLFIWDPRCEKKDVHYDALVQTIDLPATLLEFFGIPLPDTMQGHPLRDTLASNVPVREDALFGVHGGHINLVNDRYIYMRAPPSDENRPLFNYTQMPSNMRNMFTNEELKEAQMVEPFSFTQGCPLMKIPSVGMKVKRIIPMSDLLFDRTADPLQENPIHDSEIEAKLQKRMIELMRENDAPPEQYERLGLKVE